MNQFSFTNKEKVISLSMIGIGAISLILNILTIQDSFDAARVWTNVLHNAVFFTGISFIVLLLLAAHVTAQSGWHTVFKRVMESVSAFLPIGGAILLIIAIGAAMGWHDIYHWAQEGLTDPKSPKFDKIIAGKSGFLNVGMLIAFTIGLIGVWTFFSFKIRGLSHEMDNSNDPVGVLKRLRVWSAAFLPVGGFSICAGVWYWIMSIEPHWYSTLFAWYNLASWMVSGIAVVILLLYYLRDRGYFSEILPTHIHDLGKYLFGFSVFWTYLWFSQYMLIWYANVGEETVHFKNQLDHFPALFYGILIINFVIPFFVLMRNSTKWKQGSMVFSSIIILIGHWLDFYLMIKPGVYMELMHHHSSSGGHGANHDGHGAGEHATEAAAHTYEFLSGFNFPGLIEVGVMIGFVGLFVYVVFQAMTKGYLLPKQDPFLEESLHHVGGPLGPEIEAHH